MSYIYLFICEEYFTLLLAAACHIIRIFLADTLPLSYISAYLLSIAVAISVASKRIPTFIVNPWIRLVFSTIIFTETTSWILLIPLAIASAVVFFIERMRNPVHYSRYWMLVAPLATIFKGIATIPFYTYFWGKSGILPCLIILVLSTLVCLLLAIRKPVVDKE